MKFRGIPQWELFLSGWKINVVFPLKEPANSTNLLLTNHGCMCRPDSYRNISTRVTDKLMKMKLALPGTFLLVALCVQQLHSQNVAINGTGAAPDASSMLDISSTTTGILIPRMTSAQRILIAAPATGLKVYDTTTGTFWYFNGVVWVQELTTGNGWILAGNTLAGTEWMGSVNNQPVRFVSNNVERMRILGAGNVVIGSTVAVSGLDLLDVVGTAASPYAVNGYAAGNATGVWAQGIGATGFGLLARNTNASGTGLISGGNNTALNYLVAGSGSSVNGTGFGVVGWGNTVASGTGVAGSGNNSGISNLVTGSGGAFRAVTTGVFAYSTTVGAGEAIYTNQFGNIVRVNYWNGAQQFKIAGTGTMPVSCTVKDEAGVDRTLYCSESPEFYFEDYGQAQLVNGRAHIEIDSLLAKHIIINEDHPLRVYIQIEGDENCKGVVVKNKTTGGFDVVEMQGGNSNATFQWHIVCNVNDVELGGGRISHLADSRFAPMGAPREQVDQPSAVAPLKPGTAEVDQAPQPAPAPAVKPK